MITRSCTVISSNSFLSAPGLVLSLWFKITILATTAIGVHAEARFRSKETIPNSGSISSSFLFPALFLLLTSCSGLRKTAEFPTGGSRASECADDDLILKLQNSTKVSFLALFD